MSAQDPIAVAVARAHVDAWNSHDYDVVRTTLAPDVHVVVTTVDPGAPNVDTRGIDAYLELGDAVVPGSCQVTAAIGDDTRALLQVTTRVRFGPDAPEMTAHSARLYRLDESHKIAEERVIFFVRQ
ncbi:MAG TPA: nuclear transport factor 2 family protein [Solirubrobacteraceae bacterium]|nr:nuclear transport factor 2 family protein [Solirubrobacteraceae bacterium]